MTTVLLTLAGPMQAWSRERRTSGGQGVRPTSDHPTKTGVVGLIANAMGWDRCDDITELARLRFAVRADRPGVVESDYRTAGGGTMPLTASQAATHRGVAAAVAGLPESSTVEDLLRAVDAPYGAPKDVTQGRAGTTWQVAPTVPSRADYLADAVFTVALTGDPDVISRIADAVQFPARVVHLGRVGYAPTGGLLADVTNHDDPVQALTVHPPHPRALPGSLTVWAETATGGRVVHDQPVSFSPRRAVTRRETVTVVTPTASALPNSGWDPFTAP